MADVVCFGELMLRLSPPGYQRVLQARSFDAQYGGAEANVAVSLALMGEDSAFVTKLPDNPLGEAARNEMRRYGVDTSRVVFGGDRLGIYFLEHGASVRPARVIYDRRGSSIATAAQSDFDWPQILKGARWFHFTGITPALGPNIAAITFDACRAARDAGLTVSCDLNYRSALWTVDEAARAMVPLLPYINLLVANEEHARKVLKAPDGAFPEIAEYLVRNYMLTDIAVTTRKGDSSSDCTISGMLYRRGAVVASRRYPLHIVDRVGGGDAFTAGLIYATLNDYPAKEAVEFAAAAAAIKHTVEGDLGIAGLKEITDLARNGVDGRVQR